MRMGCWVWLWLVMLGEGVCWLVVGGVGRWVLCVVVGGVEGCEGWSGVWEEVGEERFLRL